MRILNGRFASSRPELGRRLQAEDLRSEGAMFGPKIIVWAECRIILGPEGLATRRPWIVQLVGFQT